ncbi:TetR/AcrR family transcriptional regulator [Geopsychrobacter electrodiphilus]|uniref:TetR/AcrR family transcriptional regulator n=1 Tax=Geopsychrobacter electrodiphilus TaxID=225196 RepID=UPI0003759F2E|nr:TetR/AcrR family transcriptional regulator [Geopsychrobacter electrodiphilus]
MAETIPRREIILQEAAHLFREKSYPGANLRELARRAGIQGGSIYHHFASKQEILFQLMDHTMTDMIERLTERLADTRTPSEKLRKTINFHIEYHVTGPDQTYITDEELRNLTPENYLKVVEKRDRYQKIIEQILIDGKSEEGWQLDEPKLYTRALIKMCAGVSTWFKPQGSLSVPQIGEAYIRLLCNGLLPR